jgi:hypothetical protein
VLLNIPPTFGFGLNASAASLRMKTSFTLRAKTIPDRGPETACDLDRIKAECEISAITSLALPAKARLRPLWDGCATRQLTFPQGVSA